MATQSKVSKKVQRMLKAGVGEVFSVIGNVTRGSKLAHIEELKLRQPGEARGITVDLDIRFLGIDADEPDEIVWLFAANWIEDGFPCVRIERFPDKIMAGLKVEAAQ
jgi:hypothetical protein